MADQGSIMEWVKYEDEIVRHVYDRILQWRRAHRPHPQTFFTAGLERQVAQLIEEERRDVVRQRARVEKLGEDMGDCDCEPPRPMRECAKCLLSQLLYERDALQAYCDSENAAVAELKEAQEKTKRLEGVNHEYWRAVVKLEEANDAEDNAKFLAAMDELHELRLGNSYTDAPELIVEQQKKRLEELRAELDRQKKYLEDACANRDQRIDELEKQVEAFQDASGLCAPPEEKGGDPGGVRPEHLRKYIEEIERERDAATKRAEEAERELATIQAERQREYEHALSASPCERCGRKSTRISAEHLCDDCTPATKRAEEAERRLGQECHCPLSQHVDHPRGYEGCAFEPLTDLERARNKKLTEERDALKRELEEIRCYDRDYWKAIAEANRLDWIATQAERDAAIKRAEEAEARLVDLEGDRDRAECEYREEVKHRILMAKERDAARADARVLSERLSEVQSARENIVAERDAATSRAAELEAGAAALRRALMHALSLPHPPYYRSDSSYRWHTDPHVRPCIGCDMEDALSSTAGTALLARHREELAARDARVSDIVRECEFVVSEGLFDGQHHAEAFIAKVRELAALSPSPARCKVTGNPCGTDTWKSGASCECEACQRWLSDAFARLSPSPDNKEQP